MENHTLTLPQLTVKYPISLPERQHLLVIGGRPPATEWLQEAAKERILWAVDRGIDVCRRAELRPKYLLGDGDSASRVAWAWGKALAIPVDTYPSEKDLTDTQLALEKLPRHSFTVITGAFGGRFDHAFANIFSCANAPIPCCLADEQEVLAFLKDNMELHILCHQKPQAISLLPLTEECSGITISGVHWSLQNARLHQRLPNAVSNVLEETTEFPISLKKGILGVYLSFR